MYELVIWKMMGSLCDRCVKINDKDKQISSLVKGNHVFSNLRRGAMNTHRGDGVRSEYRDSSYE